MENLVVDKLKELREKDTEKYNKILKNFDELKRMAMITLMSGKDEVWKEVFDKNFDEMFEVLGIKKDENWCLNCIDIYNAILKVKEVK